MPSRTAYPWFFFYRIARLVLVIFLPTLFLVLFLYRSSYKTGLVSQISIQAQDHLRILKHTLLQSGINEKAWCLNIGPSVETHFTLIKSDGTIVCDSLDKNLVNTKREGDSSDTISESIHLNQDLILLKVIPLSTLKGNMDRFDEVLFLRIVPFSILSYLFFIYFFYVSTKPLGIILTKVQKFKDDLPFNKNLQLLYEKNEWSAIEEALNKADQKLKDQINEVQAENAKSTTILESITDDIIAVDKFETILFYNTKFKKDFMKSDANTQIVPKLWQVFHDEKILGAFRSALSSGKSESLKGVNFLHGHQPDRFYDLTITPLRSADGAVNGVLGVLHDVTEFKLSEQMRVDFIANISHEIRTPLTSVRGYTQVLQSQAPKIDPSLHGFLDKIVGNTERMISLFNDLLNLSVLESRNLQTLEDMELTPLVETVASNITATYPDKRIEITHHIEQEIIHGDERLMEQVLTNLIDNACKYSGCDSIVIKVATFHRDNKNYITVTDNGPGIPKEHLPRIFERFYRVDSSREVSRGTGLGLSIVKHIINKHRGKIWAESEGSGRGTTFVIELPVD